MDLPVRSSIFHSPAFDNFRNEIVPRSLAFGNNVPTVWCRIDDSANKITPRFRFENSVLTRIMRQIERKPSESSELITCVCEFDIRPFNNGEHLFETSSNPDEVINARENEIELKI